MFWTVLSAAFFVWMFWEICSHLATIVNTLRDVQLELVNVKLELQRTRQEEEELDKVSEPEPKEEED